MIYLLREKFVEKKVNKEKLRPKQKLIRKRIQVNLEKD